MSENFEEFNIRYHNCGKFLELNIFKSNLEESRSAL